MQKEVEHSQNATKLATPQSPPKEAGTDLSPQVSFETWERANRDWVKMGLNLGLLPTEKDWERAAHGVRKKAVPQSHEEDNP